METNQSSTPQPPRSRRHPTEEELAEVIDYWLTRKPLTTHYDEVSLLEFLAVFTPLQIKGAMFLATAKGRGAYFRYLCGILHNWRRDLNDGFDPPYFDIHSCEAGTLRWTRRTFSQK